MLSPYSACRRAGTHPPSQHRRHIHDVECGTGVLQ